MLYPGERGWQSRIIDGLAALCFVDGLFEVWHNRRHNLYSRKAGKSNEEKE